MTGRRFSAPDWGQDHLSLEAVVAYVDDELETGAHHRAEAHLTCCADCRAEVVAQRQARAALRAASCPRLPSSLMHTLRCIPVEAELPPPPPGLGITADGQFVLLRDVPRTDPGPDGERGPHPTVDGARRSSRRARFGAVSGLAVGALAVGALAVPGPSAASGHGVLAGSVLGGTALTGSAAARLSAGAQPAPNPAAPNPAAPNPAAPNPAAPNPAVVGPGREQVAIAAVAGSDREPDVDAARPDSGDATTAPSVYPAPETAGVLDAGLRRRLDRTPVAFYRSP